MHIKTLLVLLPLLLNPASSLAIPPAGDQGAGPVLDPSAQQDGDIYNRKAAIPPPFHRDQRNRIENHVKPIKSEKIVGDFGIGSRPVPQKHTLNSRAPAKDSNKKDKSDQTDKSKKGKAPAKDKKPAQDTQPAGEPSGTQPQEPRTRAGKKAEEERKKAEEEKNKAQAQPEKEQKKTQGEPSETQPQPQPGSSEQKDKEKQKEKQKQSNPGDQTQTLTHRPKPKPKEESKDPKQNQPGQAPDQQGDKKDGADKKDNQGDGQPAGNNDPKKKDDKYEGTMYIGVNPDPRKKKGEEDLDGTRGYNRKIGDGNPNHPGRYGTHLPSVYGTQSHNQEPGLSEKDAKKLDQPARKRPGEREELATTGHEKTNENGDSLTEWHRITPKKQEELEKGQKPWTDEDLRKNLIEQVEAFPEHKSEDKNDKFGKLTQDMLKMCNHEQCTKQQFENNLKRSIAEQPLLRRRMESLLEERDHILTMAMR